MLSPSFVGFELPAGQHFITAEYRSTPAKAPLAVFGALVGAAALASGAWPWLRRARRAGGAQRAGRFVQPAIATRRDRERDHARDAAGGSVSRRWTTPGEGHPT